MNIKLNPAEAAMIRSIQEDIDTVVRQRQSLGSQLDGVIRLLGAQHGLAPAKAHLARVDINNKTGEMDLVLPEEETEPVA